MMESTIVLSINKKDTQRILFSAIFIALVFTFMNHSSQNKILVFFYALICMALLLICSTMLGRSIGFLLAKAFFFKKETKWKIIFVPGALVSFAVFNSICYFLFKAYFSLVR